MRAAALRAWFQTLVLIWPDVDPLETVWHVICSGAGEMRALHKMRAWQSKQQKKSTPAKQQKTKSQLVVNVTMPMQRKGRIDSPAVFQSRLMTGIGYWPERRDWKVMQSGSRVRQWCRARAGADGDAERAQEGPAMQSKEQDNYAELKTEGRTVVLSGTLNWPEV
eukprot:1159479-Pelagomonas_calceolata.AAC.1